MSVAQQGKTIDEKLLDNYINRGFYRIKKEKTIQNKIIWFILRITYSKIRQYKWYRRSFNTYFT